MNENVQMTLGNSPLKTGFSKIIQVTAQVNSATLLVHYSKQQTIQRSSWTFVKLSQASSLYAKVYVVGF